MSSTAHKATASKTTPQQRMQEKARSNLLLALGIMAVVLILTACIFIVRS